MRRREEIAKALQIADHLCVAIVVASFAATLLYCAVIQGLNLRFWLTLLVPAAAYVILGLLRDAINAPRPYDQSGFTPLLTPNKTGRSFPSRHVSSGAVISLAIMPTCLWAGILCYAATLCLAAIRVAGGLHFTRDVLAGFFLGSLFGLLCYFIPVLCQ